MRIFNINDQISIVCRSEGTRYGFRHLATLILGGYERETAKCCYYNRTWEAWEFQSVIERLAEKVGKRDPEAQAAIKQYLAGDLDWYGMPRKERQV